MTVVFYTRTAHTTLLRARSSLRRSVSAQDSVAGSLWSGLSVTSSIASTRKMDQDMIRAIKSEDHHKGSHLPTDLSGEFFFVKDTLDAAGGVQVGFGGMSMLRQHVMRGRVDADTVLAVEVEFCTHGFDGVGRGNPTENPYYKHYMESCDVIESLLYPRWNLCFVIKPGKPRVASFEIRLMWLVGSVEYCTTLHSKICSKKLPSPTRLARRIECALEGPNDEEDEFYDEVGELPSALKQRHYSPTPWLQHWTKSLAQSPAGLEPELAGAEREPGSTG